MHRGESVRVETGSAKQARQEWALRAELIADSEAADAAGDSLLLAEALTQVASIARKAVRTDRVLVAAYLSSEVYSELRLRVETLLDHTRGVHAEAGSNLGMRIGLFAVLALFVMGHDPMLAMTFRAVEFLAM